MKFLSYILSPIFGVFFFLILLIAHPLQWLALNLSGYNAHKKVVDYMNWFLVKSLWILGTKVTVKVPKNLPENTSFLFVANHQSLFDIPPMIWAFRKYHPKFVSKIELGKGIPSVSYNLKHGGAALIDRKDPKQALSELAKFSKRICKNKWSAVIFPEGTRSRDGNPKSFSPNGFKMLAQHNPDAFVIPVSINNSWKVFRFGKFPLGLGTTIHIEAHAPIPVKEMPFEKLLEQTEKTVKKHIVKT